MPFLEFFYPNEQNTFSSVFVKVTDTNSIPATISIDSMVLRPSVTFMSERRILVLCNMPSITAPGCEEICASLDMTINTAEDVEDPEEVPASPDSVSSKGSEATDCTVETPERNHEPPSVETAEILADLAEQLESLGACLIAYRGIAADGMYRFDFKGTPSLVCASIVLLRKLAGEIAETRDITVGFDIPSNYDMPWCRLIFQVIHAGFGDEATVKTRLMDSHHELQMDYDYMYDETALTDLTVENGVVTDSRYLATENPWKVLVKLLQNMAAPEPVEVAESK